MVATQRVAGILPAVNGLIPIVIIGMGTAIPVLCYFTSVFIMLEAADADALPFIIFSALSLYTCFKTLSSRPKPYNGQW